MVKSARITLSVIVTWNGPNEAEPLSGQYFSHLVLLPSFRFVTMTMVGGLSCQIIRQKSTIVLGVGPAHERISFKMVQGKKN